MFRILTILTLLVLCSLPSQAAKWSHYTECTFQKNDYFDGDSFHVEIQLSRKYTYIFRLYFVDTPETDKQIPERIQDQADYFGINTDEVLELGKRATDFTEQWMTEHDVEIFTKHEDARGNSKKKRRYAMVRDKETETYLSEALRVAAGLARVYGRETELHNNRSAKKHWSALHKAEKQAKQARAGAWAISNKTLPDPPRFKRPVPGKQPPGVPTELPTEPTEITINKTILVYSLQDLRLRGRLYSGMKITVLGPGSPGMARIRFTPSPDKIFEGQCKKSDLGYR